MAKLNVTTTGALKTVIIAVVLVPIVGAVFTESTCACADKEKAYISMMRSDLRVLVTAQEAYLADHKTYAEELDSLQYVPAENMTMEITGADSTSGAAHVTHQLTSWGCTMAWGVGSSGEPECMNPHEGAVTRLLEGIGRQPRW